MLAFTAACTTRLPDQDLRILEAAPVEPLNWTVIVAQPTAEAYGVALVLERQLFIAIGLALLAVLRQIATLHESDPKNKPRRVK